MAVEQRLGADYGSQREREAVSKGIQFETFFPSKIINPLDLRTSYSPALPDDPAFFVQKYGPLTLTEADPQTETYVAEGLAQRLVERTGVVPDIVVVTTSHLPPYNPANPDQQRRANHVRRSLAVLGEITPEDPSNTMTVSAACSSLVVALDWLHDHNPLGKNVLLVAEETGYRRTLPPPESDSGKSRLLFSDAAAAMQFTYGKDITVLSSTGPQYEEDTEGLLYMRTPEVHDSDPFLTVYRPPYAEQFDMQGPRLLEFFGHLNTQESVLKLLTPSVDPNSIDYVLEHQASSRMVKKMGKMGFTSARGYGQGIYRYGNTSSASIILDLMDGLQNGDIHEGDIALAVGYGGGLTWGANVIRLGETAHEAL